MVSEIYWTSGDSARTRKPVTALKSQGLAAADLNVDVLTRKLTVKKECIQLESEVALTFTLTNNASITMEIGCLKSPT